MAREKGTYISYSGASKSFIKAPRRVMYDKAISDGAKVLYLLLLDLRHRRQKELKKTGYIHTTQESLAELKGIKIRQLANLLKELQEHGLIKSVQSTTKKATRLEVFEPSPELEILPESPDCLKKIDDELPEEIANLEF